MKINLPFLRALRGVSFGVATSVVIAGWVLIGLIVAAIYKVTYFPGSWSLGQIGRADIVFGWIIPYAAILLTFCLFSIRRLEEIGLAGANRVTS